MSILYHVNSEFYFIRDPQGKFYIRVKDVVANLGYRKTGYKVKNHIKRRYDCKKLFDFHIRDSQIPKNCLFLEYDGIMKLIDNAYGTQMAKQRLKDNLDKYLKTIEKIPLPSKIQDKRFIAVFMLEQTKQLPDLADTAINMGNQTAIIMNNPVNTDNQMTSQKNTVSEMNTEDKSSSTNVNLKLMRIIQELNKRNVHITEKLKEHVNVKSN